VSRGIAQAAIVGNEFTLPGRRLLVHATPDTEAVISQPLSAAATVPIEAVSHQESVAVTVTRTTARQLTLFAKALNFVHQYSLGSFAILFLIVGSAGIAVSGRYLSAQIIAQIKPIAATAQLTHIIPGLSLAVPSSQLQARLQTITSQPATISVGGQAVPIGSDVIKSWLTITPSGNKAQDYLQVNTKAIDASLLAIANQYVIAPVNQVTLTNPGEAPSIVLAGKNGTALSNPSGLGPQAQQSAKSLMNAKGLNFNTPLQTVPFQAVSPCAFPKSLYADVTTDHLYAYQGCQLVNTFLTTDGRPGDTTPIGNFTIWDKTRLQTMTGPGYVQPDVPYINYFDHSGDAIHGNYWRPASVFGVADTSHGCVGVQVPEAEWIYNWAPIGTPVITYLDSSTT
jgi:lipoprotein-anchoring transpeptidase ErfK/SrfK